VVPQALLRSIPRGLLWLLQQGWREGRLARRALGEEWKSDETPPLRLLADWMPPRCDLLRNICSSVPS
jgi:hypothetical protein